MISSSASPTAAESTAVEGGELTSSPWSTGDRWRQSPFTCVLGLDPEQHAAFRHGPLPGHNPQMDKPMATKRAEASSGGSGDPLEVLV